MKFVGLIGDIDITILMLILMLTLTVMLMLFGYTANELEPKTLLQFFATFNVCPFFTLSSFFFSYEFLAFIVYRIF